MMNHNDFSQSNYTRTSVLIVDDNPGALIALEAMLKDMDVEIMTATSGTDALRRLLLQDFAMVLLNVSMSIMDGFETAAMIRIRPRFEHLPIIFVVPDRPDNFKLKVPEMSGVDYIFSPVSPQILRAKVAVFVELHCLREQVHRSRVMLQNKDDEIAHQNLMLQGVSRMKSEFLANMSHELRTPLNTIISFSELFKEGILGELTHTQKEQIELIFKSGHHLLRLINDIVNLSKIEAGKLVLELSEFSLPSLIKNTFAMLFEKAAKHHIKLSMKIEPDLEIIYADNLKLKQIIYNLLDNAVKFTPEGGSVSVAASRIGEGMAIVVKDNGKGIVAGDIDKVFNPFASLTRPRDGTGLGLSIVKRLVELHGGHIHVSSVVGKGSCFHCWLPLRKP